MEHGAQESTSSTSQFYSGRTPAEHREEVAGRETRNMEGLSFDDEQVEKFFNVSETVQWIKDNRYTRVALQLPDHFLRNAARLARIIESETGAKVFILADTSYRSCCVDEIAAAHASCDAIVHYGDACLSSLTKNIPVKFVFGSLQCNLSGFHSVDKFLVADTSVPILLLTDACYSEKIVELEEIIRQLIPKERCLFVASLADPTQDFDSFDGSNLILCLGRVVPKAFCEAVSVQVCFVGDQKSPLIPLWLMMNTQCSSLVTYDPQSLSITQETPQSWRQLRKRLFLVEKLRDASTVGLVVGSASVRGHVEAVQRVRQMCAAAGKRLYVISVGKVNVPKLSNFADIEAFILLSCPFGIILDSSDFFRPVLSMFEAEIALNPSKTWLGDGRWSADFTEFVNDSVGAHEDDGADVSLVTGRIRALNLPEKEKNTSGGQMVPYDAGDYFKNASWRGLDDNVRLDESTELVEGRTGTALGYDSEPKM